MLRLDLVTQILDYIKNLYKAEYVGFIEVTQEGTIYILRMGVPSYMMPTIISGEFDNDAKFLEYIKEELRTRNYMRLEIYKVTRENDWAKDQ